MHELMYLSEQLLVRVCLDGEVLRLRRNRICSECSLPAQQGTLIATLARSRGISESEVDGPQAGGAGGRQAGLARLAALALALYARAGPDGWGWSDGPRCTRPGRAWHDDAGRGADLEGSTCREDGRARWNGALDGGPSGGVHDFMLIFYTACAHHV